MWYTANCTALRTQIQHSQHKRSGPYAFSAILEIHVTWLNKSEKCFTLCSHYWPAVEINEQTIPEFPVWHARWGRRRCHDTRKQTACDSEWKKKTENPSWQFMQYEVYTCHKFENKLKIWDLNLWFFFKALNIYHVSSSFSSMGLFFIFRALFSRWHPCLVLFEMS